MIPHLKISTFAQQILSVKYQVLENINSPKDLKKLGVSELDQLAQELRFFVQEITKTKAGHIKSSLGVVELSIALHFVFDTPDDILVWDVGHQAYIHKILTERKNLFHSNRKFGGLSGFTNRKESVYDPFGAGHSSTSISAVSGFAEGAKLASAIFGLISAGVFIEKNSFAIVLNFLSQSDKILSNSTEITVFQEKYPFCLLDEISSI